MPQLRGGWQVAANTVKVSLHCFLVARTAAPLSWVPVLLHITWQWAILCVLGMLPTHEGPSQAGLCWIVLLI
jgi:hypothetical protein